jgi:hypoxanthine-guanine phosphoribosyltransferase
MAGVWDDFQLERKRLRDVKAEEEAEERRLAAKARKLRREFEEKVVLYGVIAGSVVFLVSVVSYMFYLIAEHARS